MRPNRSLYVALLVMILLALLLVGCSDNRHSAATMVPTILGATNVPNAATAAPSVAVPHAPATPLPTETPIPPTPTNPMRIFFDML